MQTYYDPQEHKYYVNGEEKPRGKGERNGYTYIFW